MTKKSAILFFLLGLTMTAMAQRTSDVLNRGLVAMKSGTGIYLTWRVLGEEYYDVTYNVYRNGTKLNDEPLSVSNFQDTGGGTTSSYTVRAVVRGQEQAPCKAVTPWSTSYREIKLKHEGIKSRLVPNDATCADVDGDGELEILMKFDNQSEMDASYPREGYQGEYTIFECLKLDGTRLWWVNCGPNMGDFQNNEQNIIAYDWDRDGRAEAVMRAADGTVIHMADGTTYTVGDPSVNVRAATGGGTNWFVTTQGEYLLYMDGLTGKPYQCIPYPLPLYESGETDYAKAWGVAKYDGGHRASKHFFGAPCFDGRNASIFLARGIYTRHKMVAYDVNPATHKLTQRWRWNCNTSGPWYGQGYHNYCVADVDMDGRDEIVFGAMVIDDNGRGLSTTGLGHGDAEHVGDLNPYVHGLEVFACMEDNPGTNYRDATTSKIYHRYIAGRDVGRCMAGNFTDDFPGSLCTPTDVGAISSVTNGAVSGLGDTGVNQNMRIYWDGDLCDETFNYLNGADTEGCIAKYGSWSPIYTCAGSKTNNWTKGTPCYQGDILGDWREEIIMRTADNNIRIYSTPTPTKWRNYTLWHDHQYRNAMVWQMCGYNQPPKPSYFLGEMEGITLAPPPLTMNGRTEVTNGGTVSTALNGQHAIVCNTGNSNVAIDDGAQPAVLTFNVPTWVQGTAYSESTSSNPTINRLTYTCTVSGDGLAGDARLVKQGDGILVLPKADFRHTGETNIWGGVMKFDGTMKQSPLWLNRFTQLESDGGEFLSIKADYGSEIHPGGKDHQGTITTGTLTLGFGSRLVFDLYSPAAGDLQSADMINATTLTIERKTASEWVKGGPEYLAPVIEVVGHPAQGESKIAPGKYVIGTIGNIEGSVDDLLLEGIVTSKKKLYVEDGKLIVEIFDVRDPSTVTWTGSVNGTWDNAETENFSIENEQTGFVAGDNVIFDDQGQNKTITVKEDVYPASITVNNTAAYTFGGTGAIAGTGRFTKENTGTVTMNGSNSYTGGNYLKGGMVRVNKLANQYSETGNLGGVTKNASLFTMESGAVLQATTAVENASPMKMVGEEGGVIMSNADFRMNAPLSGTVLTKKGSGCLFTMANNTLSRIVISSGSVAAQSGNPATTVEFESGTLWDDSQATTHAIHVPKGKVGTWQLTYTYYTAYSNKLTGSGTLTIVPRNTVSRVRITGDWSQFEGTVKHTNKDIWLPLDMSGGMPKGTLSIAEGCLVSNVAKTFTIGRLTGKGMLNEPVHNFRNSNSVSGNNTWEVGNSWEDGGDFIFDGTFVDGGGSNKCIFNKIGTCKMTVTGKSTHSGTTTVKGGELFVKSGAQLGTGLLTIWDGATLSGVTTTNVPLVNSSVTFNTGATLQVGAFANADFGQMCFGGKNVTFRSGAVLKLAVTDCATSYSTGGTSIQDIGRLTMSGTIDIHVPEYHTLNVGDSILLWKNVGSVIGTPVLKTVVFDEARGLYWDTTDIAAGILRVAQSEQYPPGDVNHDGDVTVADVSLATAYVLGSIPAVFFIENADVNGDGVITVTDVTKIVDMVLTEL